MQNIDRQLIPARSRAFILIAPGSAEGVFARRSEDGARCGARGRRTTYPSLPGGAGLRPGTLGCPARSSLTAWALWGLGRKRGPDAVRRRDGAPRGARILQKRMRQDGKTGAPLGAPSPRFLRGAKGRPAKAGRDYGVPGAAKNTGDDAWLGCRPRESGDPVNASSAVITGCPLSRA